MTDEAPKSAFELAMERLRKKDADAGVTATPLSDRSGPPSPRSATSTRRSSPSARSCTSRRCAGPRTPRRRALIEQEYRRDRERLASERDAKIERIRRGEA